MSIVGFERDSMPMKSAVSNERAGRAPDMGTGCAKAAPEILTDRILVCTRWSTLSAAAP